MKLNWLMITVVLIVVSGVVYVWFAKSKSNDSYSKYLQFKDVSILGRTHVEVGTKVEYNSNPPTSGNHYEEWAKNGVYDKPTDDGHLVHSLEHGYVILSYNCSLENSKLKTQNSKEGTESAEMNKSCLEFVDKLKDLVKADSWKMILIPRPSLDTNFALTAWGKIDKFDIKDASIERAKAFQEAFRHQGPEQTME